MRVQVYYNLHKHCWSIRDKKTKKVIAHRNALQLLNCTFKVQQGGRARVLREQRKNVHAFVEGDWHDLIANNNQRWKKASYNPYKKGKFYDLDTGEDLEIAFAVTFGDKIVRYL